MLAKAVNAVVCWLGQSTNRSAVTTVSAAGTPTASLVFKPLSEGEGGMTALQQLPPCTYLEETSVCFSPLIYSPLGSIHNEYLLYLECKGHGTRC